MKLRGILLLICLACLSFLKAQTNGDEKMVVCYSDHISQDVPRRQTLLKKESNAARNKGVIKSRLGKFVVGYDDNSFMTDGVRHCLKLALDVWEDKINIKVPVSFYLSVSENMDPDIAISTRVTYSRKSEDTSLPDNLYSQEFPYGIPVNDTIMVNAGIDWDSSWQYDDGYNGSVCLLSGFIRHIGHVLGFGSSLVERASGVGFAVNHTPSAFDRLIYNGEQSLADLKDAEGKEFERFFANKDVRLKSDGFVYDMYDTDGFILGVSGVYFSLGRDNILEYPIHDLSQRLPVNRETLNVLQATGWDVYRHDRYISCDSIDALGYGSLYKSYDFTLRDTVTGSSASADWEYQIYDKESGVYRTVSTYNGSIFHVEPSVIANSMDEYGCLQARVTAKFSETEYHFPLTLETRPLIEDVSVSNITGTGDGLYGLDIMIRQRGAEKGTVLVSDDSGSIHEYAFNGGMIHVSGLVAGLNVYIDVSLENEYGSASRLVQGCFFTGKECVVSISANDNSNVSDDGAVWENVLHDQDCITVTVSDDQSSETDSIKWYLCLDDKCRELCTRVDGDDSYTFNVTPESLECRFEKDAETGISTCIGGDGWGNQSWPTDGVCRFMAKAYRHDSHGQFTLSYRFDYKLDVLPGEPKINVLDVWNVEGDDMSPYARLSFDIDNYDYAALYVYEPGGPRVNVYTDTVFYAGTCDEYTIALGYYGNYVYCVALNSYGQCKGRKTGLPQTGISSDVMKDINIKVYNNIVEIENETDFSVVIYSIDGRVVDDRKNIRHYVEELSSGCYVLRVKDAKSKVSVVRKIIIR